MQLPRVQLSVGWMLVAMAVVCLHFAVVRAA
jgi:hypothetical protein